MLHYVHPFVGSWMTEQWVPLVNYTKRVSYTVTVESFSFFGDWLFIANFVVSKIVLLFSLSALSLVLFQIWFSCSKVVLCVVNFPVDEFTWTSRVFWPMMVTPFKRPKCRSESGRSDPRGEPSDLHGISIAIYGCYLQIWRVKLVFQWKKGVCITLFYNIHNNVMWDWQYSA